MTTQDCSPYGDEILRHFGNGTELRPEAREHYAGCVHCMTAVTAALSSNVAGTPLDGLGAGPVRGPAASKPVALPEAARRALAHGRQVLERVFGIRSGSGSGTPE
jgi:hypothetical protein